MTYYQQSELTMQPVEKKFQLSQEIIEKFAPLVKYLAGRIAVGLPKHVELDELISFGVLGLADALMRYDSEKGAKFETYASVRIRGAIFDGLRKMDWIPHSARVKAKELEQAISSLEVRLSRTPETSEIASELGMSLQAYYERLSEVKSINLVYLEENSHPNSDVENKLADRINDPNAELGFLEIEKEETRQILSQALDKLTEKERTVISLYYYDELTLKEIAAVLNLTESRISQIHTQAILRLRGRLSRAKKKLF